MTFTDQDVNEINVQKLIGIDKNIPETQRKSPGECLDDHKAKITVKC